MEINQLLIIGSSCSSLIIIVIIIIFIMIQNKGAEVTAHQLPSNEIIKNTSGKYTPMVTAADKIAQKPPPPSVAFPQPAPQQKIDCLFDSNKYYNAYPDVKAAGMDAAVHYKQYGINEGRSPCGTPNCKFDANNYYIMYPDVKAAGMDAAKHYTIYGINEGRLANKCSI